MSAHNPKKIVLIGPVYPYSSGISHYTGLLCRNLSETFEVTMVSFSFQYPQFLYKRLQKDYSNDSFKIEDTKFWINTLNPVNWIKTAKQINTIAPDLVIMEWWHPYFTFCFHSILCHIKNAKVIFICHNVLPHERIPFDRFFARYTLKRANGFIVQSRQDEKDLLSIFPNAVYKKTVHPTYEVFNMHHLTQKEARERLELKDDDKVLLFFGFVRKYKGLDYLIQAMPKIRQELPDIKLMIVGDFGDFKQEYTEMIDGLQLNDSIMVREGYIPDKEVEQYFASCDLVIAPYVSATQSGIIQIAYGFQKPVIATEVGGLPDVVNDGITGYLVAPCNPSAISDAVIRFFKEEKAKEMEAAVVAAADMFSWDRMKETILEIYRRAFPS